LTAVLKRLLLDTLLRRLREQGLVKAGGRQRTDSTHVLAAVRGLNRLERAGETLRAALNELAVVTPDWLQALAPAAWYERYGRRVENYRLPKSDTARLELATAIGADGQQLLATVDAAVEQPWLAQLPACDQGSPPSLAGSVYRGRRALAMAHRHREKLELRWRQVRM
jgi:transposase